MDSLENIQRELRDLLSEGGRLRLFCRGLGAAPPRKVVLAGAQAASATPWISKRSKDANDGGVPNGI